MMMTIRLLLTAGTCAHLAFGAFGKEPIDPGTSEAHLERLLREASLAVLKEGNARFAAGKSQHPNLDGERRTSTVANGQEPVATILSCSDSRSPVELIFDRGVGDLFVVRVAGNIAGESELATVEYGVDHLGTPILLVMGHTRCGAVTAVVKGTELHGHLHALAEQIQPAAAKAKSTPRDPEATIAAAIEANVWLTIENILKKSELVRERAKAGKVQLVGAVYDLETGRVAWLGSHPGQEELLSGHSTPEPMAHSLVNNPANPAPHGSKSGSAKGSESAAAKEKTGNATRVANNTLDHGQAAAGEAVNTKTPTKKAAAH